MSADEAIARRRQQAIARLGVLSGAGDPALTALARVSSYVTGASAAAIHIIDDVEQHRVAGVNAPLGTHPREDSMCRLVIDGDRRIVCADATAEAQFAYTSFVGGPTPVRFYASVPVRAVDGVAVGTLCSWDTVPRELSAEQLARLEDLAEEVAARVELTRIAAELGDAASHDPLTGVLNRLVLTDRLAHAFARQLRHDADVLVIVADVDAFKPINDTYGHDAGDEVLVTIAQRLAASVRAEDSVARIGGDEFAVVAEIARGGTCVEEIIARIRTALSAPMCFAGGHYQVGVSVGSALAEPGDTVRSAIARADAAMYERKRR
ncbi:MAG: sensor domain-containing diguanylate cyclase [Actinomycetota bacterium]|nr:sensor domain-containing diguanylate cyclase [Actinomycetota bacterium]